MFANVIYGWGSHVDPGVAPLGMGGALILWWQWRPFGQPLQSSHVVAAFFGKMLFGMSLLLFSFSELIRPGLYYSEVGTSLLLIADVLLLSGFGLTYYGLPGLRRLLPSLGMLLLCVPVPDFILQPLSLWMASSVSWLVSELINPLGVGVHVEGNIIMTAKGAVGMDEACSGVRSLQSSLVVGLLLGLSVFKRWQERTLVVFIAVFGAFVGNLLRAVTLVVGVDRVGGDFLANYHDLANSIVLICVGLTVGVAVVIMMARGCELRMPAAHRVWALDKPIPHWILVSAILFPSAAAAMGQFVFYQDKLDVKPGPMETLLKQVGETRLVSGSLNDLLFYSHALTVELPIGNDQKGRAFYAFWEPGRRSYEAVGLHTPKLCFGASGWRFTGETRVIEHVFGGRPSLLQWQRFAGPQMDVWASRVHFVGNEIRDPSQLRSLFDRLKFDLWRIRPKKQEVVMFWLPGDLAMDEIKQVLVDLDLDSLDTVARESR